MKHVCFRPTSDSIGLKARFGYPPTTPPKRGQMSPEHVSNSRKKWLGWVGLWRKECLKHRISFFGLLGFRPFFFSTIRPWLPGVEALASSRKVMICILFLAAERETDQ